MLSIPNLRFRAPAGATIALIMILVPVVTFGAKGATIRLPSEFAAGSTRVAFSGFGGFNRGSYTGAEFSGEFTRIESRLGVFDPIFVANKGKSGFTIENLDGVATLTADCRAIERTTTFKFVSLDLKKLAYSCNFSGEDAGGEMRFVIGEPKREGLRAKLLARDLRTGEASVFGHDFIINSVHEYEGTKLTSQAPLGYLLESNGVVFGAVDLLDWNPIVHLRDDMPETQRKATMIVALSLAVLRDPANSSLEEL